ncbi:hypothetical protein GQ473_06905, partial [archaeon]|nr:hypothetical protein [archaeon]
ISGQWSYVFNDTEFLGVYNVSKLYRRDADGDVGSFDVFDEFDTKILEMNTTLDKKTANMTDAIFIQAEVGNNASAIENVTAYILKPDGYLDVVELHDGKIGDFGTYYYANNYTNTTRSGEYIINITVYAQNTVTENQSFTINYGWPFIQLIEGGINYENNTNNTRKYQISAIGGDLANVTAMMYVNSSVLEFNNDTAEKNKSIIYMGTTDGWIVEWNITTINIGLSYVNLTIKNNTVLNPNGYYNERNTTVNVSADSDIEDPIIENLWIENNYTIYNLNETAIIYANISDNFNVKSAFLNITHPTGFSENIDGERVITYDNGIAKFKFEAENITILTNITLYDFYTNASDYSENTNISSVMSFNTTNVYDVSINIYDVYNRGEIVNVTLDVLNVNNLSVAGFSETINLNDTQGNTTFLGDGTYYVTPSNLTGVYTINSNVSKYGNSGNSSMNFNITDELIATVFTPPAGYALFTPKAPMTVKFRVSNKRGDAYADNANYTVKCYTTDTGVWGSKNDSIGEYTGANITWNQYDLNPVCYAATTFSTQFSIEYNLSDDVNNNTGIDTHFWITKSDSGGSSEPPSGGSSSGGGGFGVPGQNTTIIIEGNSTDYNFLLKPDIITIMKGDVGSITGVVDNIGDFDVNLSIAIEGDCCSFETNDYFYVKTKDKDNFPISLSTNLTVTPAEYSVSVMTKTLDRKKIETVVVVIEENEYIEDLNEIKTRASELKLIISQYKNSGVNVEILERQYDIIEASILKAQKAIVDNDVDGLRAEVNSLKVEKLKLEAEITGLRTILWLNENKENIIIGLVSFVFLFFFTTKFILPYAWMKTDLRHLRKREKELTEIRKSTEIQYFKRQIDEATFNKMMADKHSALIEVRTKIGDIDIALSLLMRGKSTSHEGSKKYSVSSKFKFGFSRIIDFVRRKLHLKVVKKEEVVKPRQDMFVVNNGFNATNNSKNIQTKTYSGPFASIRQKYHDWAKKKKESKIDEEIQVLEKKEKKLEKKEETIKSEISDLEKEKQDVENS